MLLFYLICLQPASYTHTVSLLYAHAVDLHLVVSNACNAVDFTITYQKRRRYEFLKSHFCFYKPFPLTLYLAESELKMIGLFFRAA